MAFVEKTTTMRRCAVIDMGLGNIWYEGVNIEGTLVMKKFGWCDREVAFIDETEVKEWLGDMSSHNGLTVFKLVYQDKDGYWVPREKFKKFRG